jgi:hypothetical protein
MYYPSKVEVSCTRILFSARDATVSICQITGGTSVKEILQKGTKNP